MSMDKSYLLIVAILIFAGSILYFYILPASNAGIFRPKGLDISEVLFSYSVKGCAETADGMAIKRAVEPERGPSIMVSGNKITYRRSLNHLCCRKATLGKYINENEIRILEIWSGQGCRCMCYSEIEATLEKIPSGHYTITVYERDTGLGTDKIEETVVITQEVAVR